MEILAENGGEISLTVPNGLHPEKMENSLNVGPESIEIKNFASFKVNLRTHTHTHTHTRTYTKARKSTPFFTSVRQDEKSKSRCRHCFFSSFSGFRSRHRLCPLRSVQPRHPSGGSHSTAGDGRVGRGRHTSAHRR